MNRTAVIAAVVFVFAFGLPLIGDAQRGRGATGEKPKVDVVQSVGCAERQAGNPPGGSELATWWLTRAADPRVTQPGMFNTNQVEESRKAPLGSLTFHLVGVTDFLTPEELLKSGQRKEFTTPENANATGELRHGRKVLVKGLLIEGGDQKRINLLAVIALAEGCQ
jgi:hypothetical protein